MRFRPGPAVRAGGSSGPLRALARIVIDTGAYPCPTLSPGLRPTNPRVNPSPTAHGYLGLFLSPDGRWGGWLQDGPAPRGSALALGGSMVRARTGAACWLTGE